MVDMVFIVTVANTLKVAGDLTKAAIDLRDAQLLRGKVIELQSVILSAQSSAISAQQDQFALVEQVRSLEKEVADLKAWDAKAEEYYLKQIDVGALAYVRKPEVRGSEPVTLLCVNCFEQKRRSFLQARGRSTDREHEILGCPHCKAEILVQYTINYLAE